LNPKLTPCSTFKKSCGIGFFNESATPWGVIESRPNNLFSLPPLIKKGI
jgi:hypothetical protein